MPPEPPPSPWVDKAPVRPGSSTLLAEAWPSVELGACSTLTLPANPPEPGPLEPWWLTVRGCAEADEELLASVPEGSPPYRLAQQLRARVLREAGEAEGALEVNRAIAAHDPADAAGGNALAQLASEGSEEERAQALALLWTHHPLHPSAPGEAPPGVGWREASVRAEVLMDYGDWAGVIETLEPRMAEIDADDIDACRARYALGRSHYKRNEKKQAVSWLELPQSRCAFGEPLFGPRMAYLKGRTEQRMGHHRSAAATFSALAEAFPDDSYADDGLVLGANSLATAGDLDGARALWRRAWELPVEGDMGPEAAFRLAWSHYDGGDGAQAQALAAALAELPASRDRFHVPAGAYWAGRWALYPDVKNPNARKEEGLQTAIDHWTRLCERQPWSYYAVLAYARLVEEAPEAAAALAQRAEPAARLDTYPLRRELAEDPAVVEAEALLAAGLIPQALARWEQAALEDRTLLERAWWHRSRAAVGDAVASHEELRAWLRTHLPDQPSDEAVQLLRVAYPDLWWTEVQAHTAEYRVPARYLHALMRTESNFDPEAISWAGARGLCQVMPATGRGLAKQLGIRVSEDDLLDPHTSMRLGAYYQDDIHRQFHDNPYLSAAGYNAGEHRVRQWLDKYGNLPTDEYVERIPFSETHGYVRRVVGTWQAYHWLQDDGPAFLDLSCYNHRALNPDCAKR
jgi:soluble lytic murein transglycosylase